MESGKMEWRGGWRRVRVRVVVVVWGGMGAAPEHITSAGVFVLGQCCGMLPSVGEGGGV